MRKLYLIIVSLALLLTTQFASAAVFTDVASNHPNFDAINYLHDKGVIEGYSDNTFRPDQKVNRVEALKIILLGSNVFVPEIQNQTIFPDVLFGTWYAKYVAKAKNLLIVKGDDSTGLFRPGDTVNLAEALKILLITNNKKTSTPSSNPYLDVPSNAWFAPYFKYALDAGLLDEASTSNVYPATPVTRGLLAELMYRLATSDYIVADGKASYYGEKFHGKTTASGEIFDASAFTAAHRTYPFGTWLKVTNVANGKSVVVRVNDRGPYAGEDRIIDLSKAAFETIASLSTGIISVKVETTSAPSTTTDTSSTTMTDLLKADVLNTTKLSCPDASSLSYIKTNTFSGITLKKELPTRVLLDEVLNVQGTTSSTADKVTAFLIDSSNNQTSYSGNVTNGLFILNIRFPAEGTFKLGILPGESGQSIIKEIKVLKNTCIEETENIQLPPVTGLDISLDEGDTLIQWDRDEYNLFKLSFIQEGLHKSYILDNLNEWRPVYKEFGAFKSANATLSLRGAKLTQKSILEPAQITWSPATKISFIASTHHEYTVNDKEVELVSLTDDVIAQDTIKAVFKPKVPVRSKAAVILPTGKVTDITLTSSTLTPSDNSFGIEVYPSSTNTVTASYKAVSTGLHFLEINNAEGLAVINVPIYPRNQYPLLPGVRDTATQTPEDLGTNLALIRSQFLSLVNSDRSTYKLNSLKIDNNLNNLAQSRSDDMVANSYFGHWDKQSRDANDLRLNYGINTLVGENLAKDINLKLAEDGLMRSAIHRSNILSEEWTRVGFGISKLSDGSYVFVQIFSTDPLNLDDLSTLRNQVLTAANKNRTSNLTLQTNINTLAQNWSQKMVSEGFFDFTDGSGNTLVDSIRNAGVNASLGTYIMGNSSFTDALSQIEQNTQIQESKWKNLGVGIKQDNLGIIKITLIYTE